MPDVGINGISGINLRYEGQGAGAPLVLLHGFSGTGAAWAGWAQRPAANRRVLIPDLRAHGRSTGAPEALSRGPAAPPGRSPPPGRG